MRDVLVIITSCAVAIGVATLFAAGLEHLPDVGIVLFAYLAAGLVSAPLAWIGTAKLLGGFREPR